MSKVINFCTDEDEFPNVARISRLGIPMEYIFVRYIPGGRVPMPLFQDNAGILGDDGKFYKGTYMMSRYLGTRRYDPQSFNIFEEASIDDNVTVHKCERCGKVAGEYKLPKFAAKDAELQKRDSEMKVKLYVRIFDEGFMLRMHENADEILLVPISKKPKAKTSITMPKLRYGMSSSVGEEAEYTEAMKEMYRIGRERRQYVPMSIEEFVTGYVERCTEMNPKDDKAIVKNLLNGEFDAYTTSIVEAKDSTECEKESDDPIGTSGETVIEWVHEVAGVPVMLVVTCGEGDVPLTSLHYPKPDDEKGWDIGRYVSYSGNLFATPLKCTPGVHSRDEPYPCLDDNYDIIGDWKEEIKEIFYV